MRPHPLMFDDEASPPALSPFEGADGLVSDANPSLLGLPAGESMLTARAVRPSAKAGPAVAQTLAAILEALRTAAKNGRAWRKRLDGLSAADQALVLDALGQGEVSVVLSGAPGEGDAQIHETVLPGVWIGQAQGAQGERVVWVEVGSAPRAL
ncbi:MAG: hydrogenase expression/formation C-terminal domain-containing protein [Maricaulaceae bacterium]